MVEAAQRSARECMDQEGEETKRKRIVEERSWRDLIAKDEGKEIEAEHDELEGDGDTVMKD